MKTELHIFDFDGTLFQSPLNTEENHRIYEETTGIPWIISKDLSKTLTEKLGRVVRERKGWWGKPETLEPPLVPEPAPEHWFIDETVEAFKESQTNEQALTVLLTGRHVGLKQKVLRICRDGNLFHIDKEGDLFVQKSNNVFFYCLGESLPEQDVKDKPSETLNWKLWIIQEFLKEHPSISKIKFWEDRQEHVEHFRSLNLKWPQAISVTQIF